MDRVLSGVRVLDFGRYIAGPFCAALLADLGAEVIRIERRQGSEDRTLIPLTIAEDGTPGDGAMFVQMNRGKRAMTLDPMHAQGRAVVKRLVKSADVVVANLPHETLKAMGLDQTSLEAQNPAIILTTASAFGTEGPYAERVGFDGIAQAMCGAAYLSGDGTRPMKSYAPWVDYLTAAFSAYGTLAALIARGRTGRGQMVEASLLATALNVFNTAIMEEAVRGPGRTASLNRSQTSGPSDIHATRDGHIIVAVNGMPLFRRWARMVGRPELIEDPRFAHDHGRGDHGAVLSAIMDGWCAERTTGEALAELAAARVPAGPVLSPAAIAADDHVRATGAFVPVTAGGVEAPVAAPPVRLSRTPALEPSPPPALGADTDAILMEAGYSAHEIAALREAGAI